MGLGCGGIAVSRGVHGFEDQIGDASHRGNHNNHAVPGRGMADDVCTLAEAFGASHGGAAKLHYDKTLSSHNLTPCYSSNFRGGWLFDDRGAVIIGAGNSH